MTPYPIQPAIKFYSSFDEALSADLERDQYFFVKEDKWEYKDIFNFPKTFIVAEPGYGDWGRVLINGGQVCS